MSNTKVKIILKWFAVVLFVLAVLTISDVYSNRIMSTKYCFKELADGSLYHYVCETK